jgi:hypothetical protein
MVDERSDPPDGLRLRDHDARTMLDLGGSMLKLSVVTVLASVVVACSSSSTPPTGAPESPDAAASGEAGPTLEAGALPEAGANPPMGVLIIGTLADSDGGLTASQSAHDTLATSADANAKALGDVSHTVLLGTSLLGTQLHQFLALDRWNSGTNIDAFYANPSFQGPLDKMFNPAPQVTVYVAQPSWAGYGTPDSANSTSPHYWVVVRGTMKYTDLAQDQAAHDAIFKGLAPIAQSAGDVGHVVYTGRDEAQLYFSIDVWPASTDIASIYGNPSAQSEFAMLFEGTPTLGVYESTDWVQW